MTPAHFKAIRHAASLTQSGLAALLHVQDIRTIRRYEHGERNVSGPVSLLMRMIERDGVDAVRELGG